MENIELELAIKLINDSIKEIEDAELISVEDCKGRILSEDIYAPINQPPFDRSPLDGYALKSIDSKGANKVSPKKLRVIDTVFAGSYTDKEIKNNEAVKIMTGAKIPKGADCVIRQENTDYGQNIVEIYSELKEYENYCFQGEDIKKGTKIISKGDKLTYIHMGILSTMGICNVKVKRKPQIALITTGDEVMCAIQPLKEGKIYDSNMMTIKARLMDFNCDVIISKIMGDDVEEVTREINNIVSEVDAIITTGGVSVGQKDIMHDVLLKLNAKRVFWRVNMKPGTPVIYSIFYEKPMLSLSGNPFAALATFELMGKEIIYKLTKDNNLKQVRKSAEMNEEFLKASKGRRFIRAICKDNKVYLPNGGHSSGMIGSMLGCNCLIDIQPGTEKLTKGDKVEIVLL